MCSSTYFTNEMASIHLIPEIIARNIQVQNCDFRTLYVLRNTLSLVNKDCNVQIKNTFTVNVMKDNFISNYGDTKKIEFHKLGLISFNNILNFLDFVNLMCKRKKNDRYQEKVNFMTNNSFFDENQLNEKCQCKGFDKNCKHVITTRVLLNMIEYAKERKTEFYKTNKNALSAHYWVAIPLFQYSLHMLQSRCGSSIKSNVFKFELYQKCEQAMRLVDTKVFSPMSSKNKNILKSVTNNLMNKIKPDIHYLLPQTQW